MAGAVTYLSKAFTTDANGQEIVDLANSIFIDWGAFISAIINFILIAFVLFIIVKTINKISENNKAFAEKINGKKLTKELKARKIRRSDYNAVKAYLEEKEQAQKLAEEQARIQAEEQAKLDRIANPTTEDLLKKIIDILGKDDK